MLVNNKNYQTIWIKTDDIKVVQVIDQRKIPFEFEIFNIKSVEDTFIAIKEMIVRGAPLIGVAGAYGVYFACLENKEYLDFKSHIKKQADYLKSSRPTAVNLEFAINECFQIVLNSNNSSEAIEKSLEYAEQLRLKEIDNCKKIGEFGIEIIKKLSEQKNKKTINILTHCNAGWLACIDYGTATAPIYKAFEEGIDIHVWVDETRPRNQGARLTAWELGMQGVKHTIIADNTGGYLMQKGMIDMVIVGSDRTTRNGDVANKVGTYLKALAAKDNNIPFYVALPFSSIDLNITNGVENIVIEERDQTELSKMEGLLNNKIVEIDIYPEKSNAFNLAFDVTPAKFVSGLITEKGICEATEEGILSLLK